MSDELRHLCRVFTLNQTLHWAITGLFLPVVVLFVISRGMDLLQAGVVLSVYSATVVLLELPTGGLSDTIGRKGVYMLSLLAKAASCIVLLFAYDLLLIGVGVVLMGVDRALSSGSIEAWFVDEHYRIAGPASLQSSLARAEIFIPIGLVVSSLVGGLAPMWMGPWMDAMFGTGIYSANLVLMLLLTVIQAVLTITLVIEHPGSRRSGDGGLLGVLGTSLTYGVKNRTVLMLMMASLVMGMGVAGLELLWQPRLEGIIGVGADTWLYGAVTAAYFLMSIVASIVITRFCALFKDDYSIVMAVIRVLCGIAYVVLAWQLSIVGFVTAYLVTYLFISMCSTPHKAMFNAEVPSERRATMMSFESLVQQLGGVTSRLAMGIVSFYVGITVAWGIGGALMLASTVFYLTPQVRSVGRRLSRDVNGCPKG